ncbi:MAG: phosphoribosylformylglycinamidine synthase [Alistipes sp.]|nr:phosphoribosylformylglycinamidine synthase [Alistipes sp.]
MKNYRIFVEKRPEFRVEAESLRRELNENLSLHIQSLRLLNVYDLFGFDKELAERCHYAVFGEIVTDIVTEECPLDGAKYLAVEYLPGQFDQRASSAVDCVRLLEPTANVSIRSSKLLIFDDSINETDIEAIKKYYINGVESREKDLSKLSANEQAEVRPVPVLEGFIDMSDDDLEPYCREHSLAMNADDLREVVRYFQSEHRNPTQTELRILDTYWSDHCRHTTFTTEIEHIRIDDSFMKSEFEEALAEFGKIREELGREHKSLCLMELATIGARYLRHKGLLDDMEQSEENNACSIFVDVDVDGQCEKWLLQFKNETHNHPTEIEPFGGASTCLGGAIRDPLSGRAYVYQAMRVTGAGDIYKGIGETLEGKLPQRIISRKAAAGYSSYGNQIGLATTHVREIYHENYVAKRLEVGAVVGAVKADHVRRESPAAGDVVLLLGGRTGRDGIGGATGSSKQHTAASLEECGSEVQKGNAPEERKLSRLFRRSEVTSLIKKSNDFGAGGVSVAIGELTDGLDIYLDRVPTKYTGLNSTELAISESQERMAIVVERKDMERMIELCHEENVEVTYVADVTDTSRMRMFNGDKIVADLRRDFIDSAGAKHYTRVAIAAVEEDAPFHRNIEGTTLRDKVINNLNDWNVVSQKGLIEMFDSTIGASTVLMPFGGRTQRTETQVSVQTLPVRHSKTNTASIMAFGYNPYISSWSPYHGAQYAVAEAVAKVVAAGARFDKMRFSYQEYFERMSNEYSWGKPMAALLGTIRMQTALGLPSIGGKDSMSGTFNTINVPPTLIAFGITTVDARTVISPEFKSADNYIYLIKHTPKRNLTPDTDSLRHNFTLVSDAIEKGSIKAAYAVGFGGVCEAIAKMSFGNEIGIDINIDEGQLFDYDYGSIVVESNAEICDPNAILLGRTVVDKSLTINGISLSIEELYEANSKRFESVYPARCQTNGDCKTANYATKSVPYSGKPVEKVKVYLPVFPGTNCDYDTARAFERAGAETHIGVFRNLTSEDIFQSIEAMCQAIDNCHILALSGGFSLGDEPDGSGKFIADVLNNADVTRSVHALLERGGLILGICNGFQALVKSGLLPYGRLGMVNEASPTLFHNDIHRHISQIVTTRVGTTASPWLSSFNVGDLHSIAVSHGEGKFVVSEAFAKELFENGQVAFQYADAEGVPTLESPFNPNGSSYAIEGIISRDGHILGKMGHTERYHDGLMKNIEGEKRQDIFTNAVNYFKGL